MGERFMLIRTMKTDDYQQVYELWLSCKGMGLNDLDDSEEGIRRFLRRNPETCFVAENEDRIIGTIIVGNDGRRGYIYHASVSLEYRKQGIATKLVNKSLEALHQIGINKVALVVFSKNEIANDFWEKQGFTSRNDLIYRNKALVDIVRIDT